VTTNLYNSFQPTPQGSYLITIKVAGKDSVIATGSNVAMTNGNAYTIFLSGNIGSSSTPLQVNVLQASY
jgi:hypothetical protein